MEIFGWAGKRLRIDLTDGTIKTEDLSIDFLRKWLGGRGINWALLWDELEPGIDPLSPENIMAISSGPAGGTLFPTAGRAQADFKSPLHGHVGSGNVGGHFGGIMKNAGYDQIVITGRADKPVYIEIDDDRVEIKDAAHLWGKGNFYTNEKIMKDDHALSVMSIGQAGEHLNRNSCLIVDYFNALGNTGPGAVWGSKNLKAIGIRGTKGTKVKAEVEAFRQLCLDEYKRLYSKWPIASGGDIYGFPSYTSCGTPVIMTFKSPQHLEPARYYTKAEIGEDMYNKYGPRRVFENTIRNKACWACPIHCKRLYEVTDGDYVGTRGGGFEYNCITYTGFQTMIPNVKNVMYINNLHNDLGTTVDWGCDIAYAIYLYTIGVLTKEDTGGLELDFGDTKLVDKLIHMGVNREGFLGNLLAEGGINIARIMGKKAYDEFCHTTGGTVACHTHRLNLGVALNKTTSTRGSDHLRGADCGGEPAFWARELGMSAAGMSDPKTTEDKHIWVMYSQDINTIADCAVWCKYLHLGEPITFAYAAKIFEYCTGVDFTAQEMMDISQRVYDMERAFQVREGVYRKHIAPPKWFFDRPYPDGKFKGVNYLTREKWKIMMDNYCELRGWDKETAVPTRAKLERMGLKYVADELEANMPYPDWQGPQLFRKYTTLSKDYEEKATLCEMFKE